MNSEIVALLIPIVAIISTFSFTAVVSWAKERRKEREAYYKNEMLKKLADSQGPGASSALELMREEDKILRRRTREGLKLGGLVTVAVGLGLMVFLGSIASVHDRGVALVGLIPLLIGVALLLYGYVLGPKD